MIELLLLLSASSWHRTVWADRADRWSASCSCVLLMLASCAASVSRSSGI